MDINNRRSFIKTTGLATSAVIASSTKLDASWFGYSTKEVKGLPQSWFDLVGVSIYQYGNYILKLKLKNITPRMVIAPHFKSRRGVRNSLPPKNMWKRMGPTLKVVDKLCDGIGLPIKEILSAYRSPEYNKAVNGNRGSYHMSNQALDVTFCKTSPYRVAHAARQLRADKVFKGGIGRYSGFIHIDTRGFNADW